MGFTFRWMWDGLRSVRSRHSLHHLTQEQQVRNSNISPLYFLLLLFVFLFSLSLSMPKRTTLTPPQFWKHLYFQYISISFYYTEAKSKQSVLKSYPNCSEIDQKSWFPFFTIMNSENRRAHAKSNPGFAAQLRGLCRCPLPGQQQLPPPPQMPP